MLLWKGLWAIGRRHWHAGYAECGGGLLQRCGWQQQTQSSYCQCCEGVDCVDFCQALVLVPHSKIPLLLTRHRNQTLWLLESLSPSKIRACGHHAVFAADEPGDKWAHVSGDEAGQNENQKQTVRSGGSCIHRDQNGYTPAKGHRDQRKENHAVYR